MIFTRSSQSCPICNGDDHFSCDFLSPIVAFIIGGVTIIIFSYLNWCIKEKDEKSYKKRDMISGLTGFFWVFSWSSLFLGGIQMNFQITFFVVMGGFVLYTRFDPKYTEVYKYHKGTKNRSEEKKLEARDIYQDFTTSFIRCFLIFILQIMLVFLYLLSVWDNGRPCFANYIQYIFYVLGVIAGAVYHVFEDMFQLKFTQRHQLLWVETHDAANGNLTITFKNDDQDREEEKEEEYTISCWEWYARRFMSILVNVYAANLIIFLLPLQVAQSEQPLNFVLNVVAAKYILQLDNHSTWDADPKSFTIHQPATQDDNVDGVGGTDGKSYQPVSSEDKTHGENDSSKHNA
jgi:hypothetical protein